MRSNGWGTERVLKLDVRVGAFRATAVAMEMLAERDRDRARRESGREREGETERESECVRERESRGRVRRAVVGRAAYPAGSLLDRAGAVEVTANHAVDADVIVGLEHRLEDL